MVGGEREIMMHTRYGWSGCTRSNRKPNGSANISPTLKLFFIPKKRCITFPPCNPLAFRRQAGNSLLSLTLHLPAGIHLPRPRTSRASTLSFQDQLSSFKPLNHKTQSALHISTGGCFYFVVLDCIIFKLSLLCGV